MKQVFVCFTKDSCCWLTSLLHKNFRHCFIVWKLGDVWYAYDPLFNHHQWEIINSPGSFDVPGWLRTQGCTVIPTMKREAPDKIAPPGLMTCCEAIKRLLGIHKFWIFTPYQLYLYLLKNDNQTPIIRHKCLHHRYWRPGFNRKKKT